MNSGRPSGIPASRTGIANLPLHHGRAPRWLFARMVKLVREIVIAVVTDYGAETMLRRLADPHWFQAMGCVLGYDWHSSGVTTTLCGALKEGMRGLETDLGLFVCGGKGKTSRKTPSEIEGWGERLSLEPGSLVYASRMSAKVDSAAVQDGYQLYHHCFIFTRSGSWTVVQQGINEANRYARRYHWLSERAVDFVNEPHSAIAAQSRGQTMNLVAAESEPSRALIGRLITGEGPERLIGQLKEIKTLDLPARHHLTVGDLHPESIGRILLSAYERQPTDFEQLLGLSGVGARTIQALSLISELIHGVPPSYCDPARYSFAHGGKDGIPYPVDRKTYDESIEFMRQVINRSQIESREKSEAHKRLARFGGGFH